MPLPKPNPGEDRDKFVSRCISFVKNEDPNTPQDQAIAICFSQWRRNLEDETEEASEILNKRLKECLL